jgi:hypothetical protein
MRSVLVTVPVAVILSLAATPGICQAPASPLPPVPEASTGISDRFRIDIGGFRMGASTVLTLNAPDASTNVDFEKDLTLPGSGTRAWADVFFRLGRRHQFNFNYTKMGRTGTVTNLTRNLTWGDYVYTSPNAAQGTASFSYIAGQYRFALVKNDRFEAGPLVGGGYFRIETSLVGAATKDGADTGTATVTSETKQLGFDLGGYFSAWLARRLQLRGDIAYMRFSPQDSTASLMDGRATLTFFPWKKIGFGAGYKYNKFSYDRGLLQTKLGGDLRYHGAVIEASFAF